MRLTCVLMVLLLATPLFADDEGKAAPAPVVEQQEESKAALTDDEISGKLESLGEAMTEARNSLEALNRLKISGYILAQYVNDESSANEINAASTRNRDQFSVREARVKFTYQFSPTSRFVLQPEVATSGVSLKDGYVEFTEPWTTWHHTLTAGQFNWPFGFEIAYSSSLRELPERSRVIRTLFPSERDRGVQLSGLGLNEKFRYEVGFVNGTGTLQTFDFNKRKDFVGHVRYALGPVDLGASIYRGAELVATSANAKGVEFSKNRTGIDAQWATPVRGLGLRGEYIRGTQPPAPGTTRTNSPNVDGWYFYAIQSIGTHHQVAVRLDEYDPNTDARKDATRTLGASYIFHWDGNSKFMFAYERPKTQGFDPDDNIFTARYAFVF
ncbi:MAG TPA: porin [Thermoanaerobaculia bacterium]|nr:porin [Thermoanaerobaculia bacterium]